MTTPDSRRLRAIPSVGGILSQAACVELIDRLGREPIAQFTREAVDSLRIRLSAGDLDAKISRPGLLETVLADIQERAKKYESCRLGPVINATGVILHTSLGRAPLSERATAALVANSRGCSLEVELDSGERSQRGDQLLPAFRDLTGAKGALVVNNNAAATVLALSALAAGREVIISRGQLIEIGGSFRLPEIFAASGAVLREVGATNRTHLTDYARAITPATAAILRVHPSNYRIEGFAHSPEIGELVDLARQNGVWAIDDIGSGCLVDTTRFGLPKEPTFTDSLRAGADLVLGSGDKLLGGPQCGILLGRPDLIETLRRHPLARAFRVDKLTIAALQATLDSYLRGAEVTEIPTLRLLSTPVSELVERAGRIVASWEALGNRPADFAGHDAGNRFRIDVVQDRSPVGGGALPVATLPTAVIRVAGDGRSASQLARQLRLGSPAVFPRIECDHLLLDLRSVLPDEDSQLVAALCQSLADSP